MTAREEITGSAPTPGGFRFPGAGVPGDSELSELGTRNGTQVLWKPSGAESPLHAHGCVYSHLALDGQCD